MCPFCGVGCLLTYHVNTKQNVIKFVNGKDGPSNHNRLCVKGRYGFDYAAHPQRLTKPLIRKPGFPKTARFHGRSGELDGGVPGGDLGRGAGSRGRRV